MAMLLEPAHALLRELVAQLVPQVPGPDLLGNDADELVGFSLEDAQRVVQRALVAADQGEDVIGGKLVMIRKRL